MFHHQASHVTQARFRRTAGRIGGHNILHVHVGLLLPSSTGPTAANWTLESHIREGTEAGNVPQVCKLQSACPGCRLSSRPALPQEKRRPIWFRRELWRHPISLDRIGKLASKHTATGGMGRLPVAVAFRIAGHWPLLMPSRPLAFFPLDAANTPCYTEAKAEPPAGHQRISTADIT